MMKSKMHSKKRIPELDIAKGIAIMGVMMVHLASEYRIISYGIAFHIVTFFAVSGILEKEGASLRQSILRKIRSLLYPYLMMSIIYIVVYSIIKIIKDGYFPGKFILGNLYLTLSGTGIGTLWFLPTAFAGTAIYALVRHFFGKKGSYVLIALMILCVFGGWGLYCAGIFGSIQYTIIGIFTNELQLLFKGCIASGFMQIGRFIWKGIKILENKCNVLCFYIVGGATWALYLILYRFYRGNDLHYVKITSAWGFLAGTILGVTAVLFLSKAIAKIPVIRDIFQYFGRNSLIVMTTHLEYKVVRIVPMIIVNLGLWTILQNALIYVVVCIIEVIICEVVNRTILRGIFYFPVRKHK